MNMIGGLKKTTSRAALAAATGLFVGGLAFTPAMAADLGGDCCADLEERVAELEATTVRKGNRKVSLTLSGHVNTAVLYWDDGVESDTYVVTNNNSRSRFRMVGKADIGRGWSAGFLIELGLPETSTSNVNEANDDGNQGAVVDVRHNVWWISNKRLGTISVGQTGQAVEGASEVDLTGTGLADYLGTGFTNSGFRLTNATGGADSLLNVGTFFKDNDGNRRDVVRYDTPTFMGFTVSASWGDDDEIDAALRYAKEFRGVIRVAAAIGYLNDHDDNGARGNFEAILGSISIQHIPTGLVASYAHVSRDYDAVGDPDSTTNAIKVGISRKFNHLGKTSMTVSYGWMDDTAFGATDSLGDSVTTSDANFWGFGIVQKIDAAAMELYAGYRHWEVDSYTTNGGVLGSNIAGLALNEFDSAIIGARIKF